MSIRAACEGRHRGLFRRAPLVEAAIFVDRLRAVRDADRKNNGMPFTWLTATNRGTHEVCEAALRVLEVSEEELAGGFKCDPTSKSTLRIVAKPGILLRLTRNFDKTRGFVNSAVAEVVESLRGNAVFVVRLVGTGNLVLVHPMEEDGQLFLPCCYGYSTTIRRAQGASLEQGCTMKPLSDQ